MDAKSFDRVSRVLAGRLSRRRAVGGSALAAAGLAAVSRRAAAQDGDLATPDVGEQGDNGSFLFVQTAHTGTFVPNPGAGTPEVDGTPVAGGGADFLLTLEGHTGGTIYFSDRPERVVGEAPTQQFLDGLGFDADDPPNAALVVQTDQGEDVAVLELFTPAFDETAGTITYGAKVLESYGGEGLASLAELQQDDGLPEQFSRASLFIDDCADKYPKCWYEPKNSGTFGSPGSLSNKYGFCYSWANAECAVCKHEVDQAVAECNATYPDVCTGSNSKRGTCWVIYFD